MPNRIVFSGMSHQDEQAIAQRALPSAIELMEAKGTHSSSRLPQSELSKSSSIYSRPGIPGRQPIAVISVHGDPAADVGKEEARGQNAYVRQVGEALAKLGWQVDMFTRKTNPDDPPIVQHSPYCRTIHLVAGPQAFIPRDEVFEYLPQFAEAFQKFESKEGTNYPLVHTHYWLSAWVGLQLKQLSNIQLVHTYHFLRAVKYQTLGNQPKIANTRLAVERQILEQADCIVATRLQEQEQLRSLASTQGTIKVIPYFSWNRVAIELSDLYRRLLAQSIMDERLWHLPLPSPWETAVCGVALPSVTPTKSVTLVS